MMKGQYFIFSDTGHIDSGNDLPLDQQIVGAKDKRTGLKKFRDSCDHCEKHFDNQRGIVKSNPSLIRDTSGFYWWVYMLRLPMQINYTADDICDQITKNLKGGENMDEMIVCFDGNSLCCEDVLEKVQSWLEC